MTLGKVFTTARGERAVVRLADGTIVTLAPASQLREAADYNNRSRTVDLDGEALFDVVHDVARPFTVRAQRAVIRDVGTRFVVDAYGDRPSVSVVVTAGRVALSVAPSAHAPPSTLPTTELVPGDRAVVADARIRAVDHGADTVALMGWVDGEVRVRDTPLADVAASLSRWYDVDVRVADPALGARHVSVSFGHEQLDNVLDGLAAALDVSWERHAGAVVLTARPPTPLLR